jgi:uncharacterized membrane protein YfcA
MTYDAATLAIATVALLLAGIGKGGFGGVGGFAATPILVLAVPPGDAVGVMLPLLMLMDAAALKAFWRRWAWPDLRMLMAGMALGTALGWALFDALSPGALKIAIALVAFAFLAQRAAQKLGWRPPGDPGPAPLRAAGWGAVAGVTSFVAHAGGPPVAMHLLPRRFDKTTLQATIVGAFAFVNVMKLPPYLSLGLIREDTALFSLSLAPVALIGIRLGVWLHGRASPAQFERVLEIGLGLAAAKLAWDGWTAL